MSNDDRPTRLGDMVKKVTEYLDIEQCDNCKVRQEKLNKMHESALNFIKKVSNSDFFV